MSWAAVVGAVVSAGVGAAGAAGAFSPDIERRNLGQETKDSLQARLDLAPQLRGMTREDALSTSGTNIEALLQQLFGTPGGTRQEAYQEQQIGYVNPYTGEWQTNALPGRAGKDMRPEYRTVTKYRDVSAPATRGLLDIFQKDLLPAGHAIEQANQANRVDLLRQFGGQYIDALKSANPEQTALRNRLMADAQSELDAGASLTPEERRRAEQFARSGAARRGLGMGAGDSIDEAVRLALTGEDRRNARRAFAGSVIGLDQSLYGDPYRQLFGAPSGATPVANNFLNQGNAGAQFGRMAEFDPFTAGAGVHEWNANAGAYSAIQRSNSLASGVTGALKGLGGINYGSLFGGGAPAGTVTTGGYSYAPGYAPTW